MNNEIGEEQFSIVIATHNRYRMLNNLLESISATSPKGLSEIIVVDDSDQIEKIPEEINSVKLFHVVLDQRSFISASKNIGWKHSKSEYLYFIDDDNIVDSSTFEIPLQLLKEGDQIAAVVPSVLYKRDRNLVWVYATPFSNDRWGHELIGRNKPRDPKYENRVMESDALPNAFAIRKRCLEQVGGFDENFPVHNSTLLAFRLKESGWSVVSATSSFVYHDVHLPDRFGYWAEHGISDPSRQYHEVMDWINLMRILHPEISAFRIRAVLRAMRFIAPNSIVYIIKGKGVRISLILNIFKGLLDGIKQSKSAGVLEE